MVENIMFRDLSVSNEYPKTLDIRSEMGGLIWQTYHVNNVEEAIILSNMATVNGYGDVTLNDYDMCEETYPNWRDTDSWKDMWDRKMLFMDYTWVRIRKFGDN